MTASHRQDRPTGSAPGGWTRALPFALTLWWLLGLVALVLASWVPRAAITDPLLTPTARIAAFCAEPAALGLVLAMLAVSTVPVGGRLWMLARRPATAPVNLAVALALWVVVSAYVASWYVFGATGQFIDATALRLFLANPGQMLQHVAQMAPLSLAAFPLMTLALALGHLSAYRALVRRQGDRPGSRLLWVLAAPVLLSVVVLVAGEAAAGGASTAVREPYTGVVYGSEEYFVLARRHRAGPVSRIVGSVARRAVSKAPVPAGGDDLRVFQSPLVAIDDYLAGTSPRRWNVLVILVESLRPDQLQSTGATRDVMPAVNGLAREGRVFTNAYSQSSHSSYADMAPLSSHYPLRSRSVHLYPENPSYPRVLLHDVLKHLGWNTAVFSSQNEHWGRMYNYLQTGNIDRFLHAETFDGPTYVPRTDHGFADWVKGQKRAGKIDDRFTVDEAIRWIDGLGGGPFYFYMNLQNSHVPYDLPADFPRRFGPEEIDFPLMFGYFPTDKIDVVKDLYADSLAYVDVQLGRLFGHLRETGQWDRTLVVLTGDTGQAFYEHGFSAHGGQLYNEVVHVPLIVRAPDLAPGIDDRPAQHVDVPPTVLALLGLPPHPAFQGISLVGPDPRPQRSIYLVAQTPIAFQRAIVRGNRKLIYDEREDRHVLYDLENDPGERNDISAAEPETVERLAARLDRWYEEQIAYYADETRHRREYPPILLD